MQYTPDYLATLPPAEQAQLVSTLPCRQVMAACAAHEALRPWCQDVRFLHDKVQRKTGFDLSVKWMLQDLCRSGSSQRLFYEDRRQAILNGRLLVQDGNRLVELDYPRPIVAILQNYVITAKGEVYLLTADQGAITEQLVTRGIKQLELVTVELEQVPTQYIVLLSFEGLLFYVTPGSTELQRSYAIIPGKITKFVPYGSTQLALTVDGAVYELQIGTNVNGDLWDQGVVNIHASGHVVVIWYEDGTVTIVDRVLPRVFAQSVDRKRQTRQEYGLTLQLPGFSQATVVVGTQAVLMMYEDALYIVYLAERIVYRVPLDFVVPGAALLDIQVDGDYLHYVDSIDGVESLQFLPLPELYTRAVQVVYD